MESIKSEDRRFVQAVPKDKLNFKLKSELVPMTLVNYGKAQRLTHKKILNCGLLERGVPSKSF